MGRSCASMALLSAARRCVDFSQKDVVVLLLVEVVGVATASLDMLDSRAFEIVKAEKEAHPGTFRPGGESICPWKNPDTTQQYLLVCEIKYIQNARKIKIVLRIIHTRRQVSSTRQSVANPPPFFSLPVFDVVLVFFFFPFSGRNKCCIIY